ncbi:recombinase family protein [Streptomyces sp. 900105755]
MIGDAGPHPNPAKAATGQRIHRLEPDPAAAPIVARIFQMYVDGMSDKTIAAQLTREGTPCPSAHDAARNPTGRAFAPDRLAATLTALAHARSAANAAETLTPQQALARTTVKECERRLARYQTTLEAGADPAVVTQWINEAQADQEAPRRTRPRCATGGTRGRPPDRHAPPVPPVSRDGPALRPRRADDGFATEGTEGTAQ